MSCIIDFSKSSLQIEMWNRAIINWNSLRLRLMQRALQLLLWFFSLSPSCRCFRNGMANPFFANSSPFVTQEACDQDWTCFPGNWFIVSRYACGPRHAMRFRKKSSIVKLSEHMKVIKVFQDIHSTLHTVNSIRH